MLDEPRQNCLHAPAIDKNNDFLISLRDLFKLFERLPVFEGQEADTALLNNAARCHRLFGPPAVSDGTAIDGTKYKDW